MIPRQSLFISFISCRATLKLVPNRSLLPSRTFWPVSVAFLTLLVSCSEKNSTFDSDHYDSNTSRQYIPPKVTVLSDLPDSLQPRKIYLDLNNPVIQDEISPQNEPIQNINDPVNLQKPNITRPPILKDESGNTIFDSDGKPYILGEGFISHFTHYTTEDGLPGNHVYYTYLDRSGNLWVSVLGLGVTRYDGVNFTTFTKAHGLTGNNVVFIFQDQEGHMWFCTWGDGISRYDGISFTNYTTEDGLADNVVWCAAQHRSGELWFGTEGGASRFNGYSFTTINRESGLANDHIRSILVDQIDNIWFAMYGGGVSRYDGEYFTAFNSTTGLSHDNVVCITEDKAGVLWLGTDGGGAIRYDPDSGKFTTYTTADGLGNNWIKTITVDEAERIWFGTQGGGLSRFEPDEDNENESGTFITYTKSQGLLGNEILSITSDPKGYLWIGTYDGGLTRYDGPDLSSLDIPIGNGISRIIKDSTGLVWFRSRTGTIGHYDGESLTTFIEKLNVYTFAFDHEERLWLGTYGNGLFLLDGESLAHFNTSHGLASNTIRAIYLDSREQLWLGTNAGVLCMNTKESITTLTTYTEAQGLPDNIINSIGEDAEGNMWFGTWRNGVSQFDGYTFYNFNSDHGLGGDLVIEITSDLYGNLWFATRGGLSYLTKNKVRNLKQYINAEIYDFGGSTQIPLFNTVNIVQGLVSSDINGILPLPDGKMAIANEQALTIFDLPEDLDLPLDSLKGLEIFDSKGGFSFQRIQQILLDENGSIWCAASSLSRFDYHKVIKNAEPATVSLHQVRINNDGVVWHDLRKLDGPTEELDNRLSEMRMTEEALIFGRVLGREERSNHARKYDGISFDSIDRFYPLPQGLILPYQHNEVSIHFGAKELARPKLVVYQYKLEGRDRDWRSVTTGHQATFQNLKEGNYTFKVRARYTGPSIDNGDEWTEPVTYSFRVMPPWYRSGLAYATYLIFFGAGLFSLIKWRTISLRRQRELLRKRVDEQTQELLIEKERSDSLLLNILPATVAQELKLTGKTHPVFFEEVSIMFADFKGFTNIVASIPGKKLISELDEIFQIYDDIMEEVGLEKIQTIGDSYLAACGVPNPDPQHAVKCVVAAQKIITYLKERNQKEGVKWSVRIGIHSGSVTAGVIGKKKFSYDLFGDTINIASRIESSGEAGRINVSAYTYTLIKDQFICEYRGKINAKGKGELDMYFVA